MGTLECSEEVEVEVEVAARAPMGSLLVVGQQGQVRRRLGALLEEQLRLRQQQPTAVVLMSADRADCRRAMVEFAARFLKATRASFESFEFATITFDRYVSACLAEGSSILDNRAHAYYSMLACIFVATKLIETHPVALSELASGVESMVLEEELNIVAKLDYLLPPLVTPSSFIRHLLALWPDHTNYLHIYDDAQAILSVCCKERFYVKFAYSTMAVAAVVYAFSRIALNCQDWLEHVPDEIVKLDQDTDSLGQPTGHGSVWNCYSMISAFFTTGLPDEQEIHADVMCSPAPTARAAGRSTPTSITELEEPPTPRTLADEPSLCSFSPLPQTSRIARSVARRIAGEMNDAEAEENSRKRLKHDAEGDGALAHNA